MLRRAMKIVSPLLVGLLVLSLAQSAAGTTAAGQPPAAPAVDSRGDSAPDGFSMLLAKPSNPDHGCNSCL